MRLLELYIEQCRSVRNSVLPLEGLVVLFGPNSAGKSTVLEAAGELLGASGRLRRDPGDDWSEHYAMGSVFFELPAAGLPGSADAELMRDLLVGRYAKRVSPWTALDPDARERLAGVDLDEAKRFLVELLVGHGSAGTVEDRATVATAWLEAPLFSTDGSSIMMLPPSSPADGRTQTAAVRVASAQPGEEDLLARVASAIHRPRRQEPRGEAGEDSVAEVVLGEEAKTLLSTFAPVVTLDGDPARLANELEEKLPALHNLLWASVPAPPERTEDGTLWEVVDEFLIAGTADGGHLSVDPWLEVLVEDRGETRVATPEIFDPYNLGAWSRARHSLIATAKVLSEHANSLAPGFIQDYGTIEVEVLPVAAWPSAPNRVRVTVTEHEGERRDLGIVGSGTARWVSAALRLACEQLLSGRRVVTDERGTEVTGAAPSNVLIERARSTPLSQSYLRVVPGTGSGAVYLVDEPEAHLHPLALRSVVTWLEKLAETAAAVVVATHHPALLSGSRRLTKLVVVTRKDDVTELKVVDGSPLAGVTAVNDQIGLTPGELLLLSRLVLLVEGEHDRVVLNEWFGDKLAGAGVRVIPLRGIDNLVGLPLAELVVALGIPIAVLSDGTDMAKTRSGRPRTRGEKAVAEFLWQAERRGLDVKAIGLARPDILWYLDPGICRQLAPGFSGWPEAKAARHRAGGTGEWKDWVRRTYGLALDVDTVRDLARRCRVEDKIPQEFKNHVRELLAYASG